DPVYGRDRLAQYGAVVLGVGPRRTALVLVIAAYAGGSGFKGVAQVRRQRLQCLLALGVCYLQRRHAGSINAIEATGVIQDGLVAMLAYVGQNVCGGAFYGFILGGIEREQCLELPIEAVSPRVKSCDQ